MKFYVHYSLYQYDGWSDEVFDTLEQVLSFLNEHAENPEFRSSVIHGKEVDFEPAVTVKAFRKKEP